MYCKDVRGLGSRVKVLNRCLLGGWVLVLVVHFFGTCLFMGSWGPFTWAG